MTCRLQNHISFGNQREDAGPNSVMSSGQAVGPIFNSSWIPRDQELLGFQFHSNYFQAYVSTPSSWIRKRNERTKLDTRLFRWSRKQGPLLVCTMDRNCEEAEWNFRFRWVRNPNFGREPFLRHGPWAKSKRAKLSGHPTDYVIHCGQEIFWEIKCK